MKTTLRSVLTTLISLSIGIFLIMLLLRVSGMHWKAIRAEIADVDRGVFLRLSLLLALNSFFSSLKWRITDRAMNRSANGAVPLSKAFALTTIGVALAQVMPVQVSMSIARTLGSWTHSRVLRRGTIGTLFEQAFDLLILCLLLIASIATRLLNGNGMVWLALVLCTIVISIWMVGIFLTALKRWTLRMGSAAKIDSRWRRIVFDFYSSGLLESGIGYRLMSLSALRFALLVLMAWEVSVAIHANIPVWQLGVALPFASLAVALGITPGGMGLTEISYTSILGLYGISLSVTTQWAVASRILTGAAAFLVSIVGMTMLLTTSKRTRNDGVHEQAAV